MTQNMLNANGKRSPAEGARTDGATNGATYAKGKRVRVKQRLDEIGKDVDALERQQATSNGGLMSMLLVLQKTATDARKQRSDDAETREENDWKLKRESAKREKELGRKKRGLQNPVDMTRSRLLVFNERSFAARKPHARPGLNSSAKRVSVALRRGWLSIVPRRGSVMSK